MGRGIANKYDDCVGKDGDVVYDDCVGKDGDVVYDDCVGKDWDVVLGLGRMLDSIPYLGRA